MRLPNADKALVSPSKIVGYLLSERHEDGRHKARFFKRFGYRSDRPSELVEALRGHAATHEVTNEELSPFGKRFVIEGIMSTPDGRSAMVRSVWMIREGEEIPRFVTAYPLVRLSL